MGRSKNWGDGEKGAIILDDGAEADAVFPVVISASRSTDIPAFYCDWFFERLKKGYSAWINPFNGKKYYIGYKNTKFIVFWSKNPQPLLARLNHLRLRGIGCCIQFTLNDYRREGLECGVPPLNQRIATFRHFAQTLGKGAVIWRFDPLLLTPSLTLDHLLQRINCLGAQLHEHTEKLVFSFADIQPYKKVKANLDRKRIPYREWTLPLMAEFAEKLAELNESAGWNLELAACGEAADLPGIRRSKCIDERLILRLCPDSPELLKFFGAHIYNGPNLFGDMPPGGIELGNGRYAIITKKNRDPGQRRICGCAKSKDIGEYNTCPHMCEYCYANVNTEAARRNHIRHLANPHCETISGR